MRRLGGKRDQTLFRGRHSSASADGAYKIFIQADQGEPLEILDILIRELALVEDGRYDTP